MTERSMWNTEIQQVQAGNLGGKATPKGNLQQLIIPLDLAIPNALNNGEYRIPGLRFWVDAKTNGQALVFFDDNSVQLGGIPCVPGMVLKMPIDYIYIVSPAQPGADLVINWGIFDVVPPLISSVAPAFGLGYQASYKSTSALAANTPDNIVANTSNVGGIDITSAQYLSVGAATGFAGILAKFGAVAPASVIDGDVILLDALNTAAIPFNTHPSMANPILVRSGRRLDRMTNAAESSSYVSVLYTLLNP